jgi:hypothetical protein
MMEAVSFSETFVPMYETTRNIPEGHITLMLRDSVESHDNISLRFMKVGVGGFLDHLKDYQYL